MSQETDNETLRKIGDAKKRHCKGIQRGKHIIHEEKMRINNMVSEAFHRMHEAFKNDIIETKLEFASNCDMAYESIALTEEILEKMESVIRRLSDGHEEGRGKIFKDFQMLKEQQQDQIDKQRVAQKQTEENILENVMQCFQDTSQKYLNDFELLMKRMCERTQRSQLMYSEIEAKSIIYQNMKTEKEEWKKKCRVDSD